MKLTICLLACAVLTGCGDSKSLAGAMKEVTDKCAKPVSLTFTYSPGLFNNGSLSMTCPEVLK